MSDEKRTVLVTPDDYDQREFRRRLFEAIANAGAEPIDLPAPEEEAWTVCAECGVNVRVSNVTDGLCHWCTPEGRAEAEGIDARRVTLQREGFDIIRQPHERRGEG